MNHKRRRPKNRRAGCLMCKPHKMNGAGCANANRHQLLTKLLERAHREGIE